MGWDHGENLVGTSFYTIGVTENKSFSFCHCHTILACVSMHVLHVEVSMPHTDIKGPQPVSVHNNSQRPSTTTMASVTPVLNGRHIAGSSELEIQPNIYGLRIIVEIIVSFLIIQQCIHLEEHSIPPRRL